MADIRIRVEHGLARETAQRAAATVLAKMAEKMGVQAAWNGDEATLSGTGVKNGSVVVDDQHITVDVTLGLMAKPMKGFVEEKIRQGLNKALGRAEA